MTLVANSKRGSVRVRWFHGITGVFPILLGNCSQGWNWSRHPLNAGSRSELVDVQLVGTVSSFCVLDFTIPWNRCTGLGWYYSGSIGLADAVTVSLSLAWIFPALKPTLSSFLWREQTAPQTRLGQALLTTVITIVPVAGVLGASIGMYGSRFGETTFVLLVAASLGSVVSIGFAFAAAYQL